MSEYSTLEQATGLRRRAEEKAKGADRVREADGVREHEAEIRESLSPEVARRVRARPVRARRDPHEMWVHQIEIKMQNEELRRAQAELDAARAWYFDLYDLAPVGYCTVSEKGLILEANLTAATLLGADAAHAACESDARGALVKQPITRFILKEDQDIFYRLRKILLETGGPQVCEVRMAKMDGTQFWAHLAATAAQDADGEPVYRVVMSDITGRKQAEENANGDGRDHARRELEALARFPAENPNPVFRIAENGILLYSNAASAPLLAHEGMEAGQVVPDKWRAWMAEAFAAGCNREIELDCDDQTFSLALAPIAKSDYANVYGLNLTQRKRAEHDLLASETRYRRLFESAKDGILILDAGTGQIVDVNPYLIDLLGFTHEYFLGKKLWEIGFFKDIAASETAFLELQEKKYIRYEDLPLRTRDGQLINVEFVSNVYPVDSTTVVQCNIRDITERKRAEQSQARLLAMLEATPDFVGFADPKDTHLLHVNPAGRHMCGLGESEDVTKLKFADVHPEWTSQLLREQAIPAAIRDGVWKGECAFLHRDGREVPVLMVLMAHKSPSGELDVLSTISRDITERKQAAELLRQSEAELQCILDTTADGVLAVDGHGKVVKANRGFAEIWHIPQAVLDAKDDQAMLDCVLDQLLEPEAFLRKVQALYKSNVKDVDTVAFKDGRIFERYSAPLLTTNSGMGRVWFFHEITEQERAEEALRASEAKFRSIVDNIGIGIALIGNRMQIIEINRQMREWFPDIRQEEHPLCHRAFNFPPCEEPCSYCPTIQTLRDGKVHEAIVATPRQGGARNYRIVSSPIHDDQGRVVAAIEMVDDITEQLSLQQQLNQAQKMESIGQLAGGVAHDFNNILQAMVGYSSMLLDRLPEHDETHEFAEEIAQGAERAAVLTRQLLAFSRRQILEMENLELNEVVHGLTKMIRRIIGEDVEVVVMEGRRLGIVHADRGQMEQVLLNLCINARDAMPEGGVLTIGTENVVMDSDYCDAHAWASPGRYVLLSVTDTGCGMDAQTQARIFEPFFTTKELDKGTGLGLATVYGIVRQHQGMIQVYSEVGKGTTFKVYLPSIERTAATVKTEVVGRARGGAETILLAEDDEALRKLAAHILESAGYTVLLATNGEEALDLFEKHTADIDLCLLDVVMPKMGGKSVYDVLRRRHPRLRFLFSSGYSTGSIHTGFVLKEGIELIQKPYAPDALLRKVRNVLDRTDELTDSVGGSAQSERLTG